MRFSARVLVQIYVAAAALLLLPCSSAFADSPDNFELPGACGAEEYKTESARLSEMYDADQALRQDVNSWSQKIETEMIAIIDADKARQIEVGSILAKGCLKDGDDYFKAAMIFQHSQVQYHYRLSLLLAQLSAEAGDERGKHLVPLTIDRWLINRGNKQLFGTQGRSVPGEPCVCMMQIEPTFPDAERERYGLKKEMTGLPLLSRWNTDEKKCPPRYCDVELKSTPRGSFPGVW